MRFKFQHLIIKPLVYKLGISRNYVTRLPFINRTVRTKSQLFHFKRLNSVRFFSTTENPKDTKIVDEQNDSKEKSDTKQESNAQTNQEQNNEENKTNEESQKKDTAITKAFKRILWWGAGTIAGVLGAIVALIYYTYQDILKFGAYAEEVQKCLAEPTNSTSYMVKLAHNGLVHGIDILRKLQHDEITLPDEKTDELMFSVFGGDWKNDNIRALNTNFVCIPSHTFYFAPKITNYTINDGKIIKKRTSRLNLSFYDTKLNFYYPIVSTTNGALAILKVSMISMDESKDEMMKHKFEIESISIANAAPFIEVFGLEYFSQLRDTALPQLTYSFPDLGDKEKKSFSIFECMTHRKVEAQFESIVAPMTYTNPIPEVGHLIPQTVESLPSTNN